MLVAEPWRASRRLIGMGLLASVLRLTALAGAVAALTGGMVACGSASNKAGNVGEWPADRTFVSSSLTGRTLVAGTRISLVFHRNGSVSAHAGCNQLTGTGRLAGGRLNISQLRQTMIGCDPQRMNQDQWLAAFLTARPRWHLAGNQLRLTSDAAQLTLTDLGTAGVTRGLAGTRWTIETLGTGQTASSVPAHLDAYLTFDGTGHISGSDGCGPITGTAVIGNATVTIALASTSQPCPAPAAAARAAIRATLRGAVRYTIRADTLTLAGPNGHSLLLRAHPS
jgi:heat shock protein HslJ